ncbi:hypothetical protein BDV23DRAFT_187984 [Aspergillus alliaceus]|uniref:Rhodopsin domain-containing protein n=1 Tax=Petromyces alliaceus TaxID=209559 RepID=A0A5N7BV26_PETAA|nr:hypothetical protein BDV23DRAFT_187984 [Aspergillus alliaceus]
MSILFLYLRIFPIILFRRFDFLCICFLIISFLVTTPMAIWQCKPFRAAWDYEVDNARCLNIAAVAYANAIVNMITEVLILILPLPVLRTLRVSLRKKIAIISVFSAGVMVIAIASARMPALAKMGTYYDPPHAQAPAFLLSCAEAAMAHVCAAAPVIYTAIVQIKRSHSKDSETSRSSSQWGPAGADQSGGSGHSNKKAQGMINTSMNMSDVAIMGRGWIQGQCRSQGPVPSSYHLEDVYHSGPGSAATTYPDITYTNSYCGSRLPTGQTGSLHSAEVNDPVGDV